MKNTLLLVASVLLFTQYASAQTAYGKKFDPNTSVDVPSFLTKMQTAEQLDPIVVKGEIVQVCQVAGCWVKLKNAQGKDIFVKFKEEKGNHELTVPKNVAGKTAIVYGKASKKTVPVSELKHLAKDAGMPDNEIAKIDKPQQEIRIDATGVIIN